MRCVSPRLQPIFLLDCIRKTSTPFIPRKCLVDINPRISVHNLPKLAHIVIDSRQLNQLPQEGQLAYCSEVLVPDDGLADRLGLGLRGFGLLGWILEQVEREDAPVELKRQLSCAEVIVCCPNVVE